ncbi:Uncharacterized protein FWK35_00003283 [Aphis craccivora]|uniref:Uncharacterized protein n=1 Tax=Aphis craccivora TaxID=307492 RepID=A0A6G0ZEQ0_APHCR|nr:Uncharacterized protein FWK35_00003283 [Aphis craccivora]
MPDVKIKSPSFATSSMPNIAVISDANDDVLEIRSLTSAQMQKISGVPAVPEMARGRICRSAEKMWCSIPNIHLMFDTNNANKSKCIPMMQVFSNAENGLVKSVLDPITDLGTVADELTATTVEKGPRRRSLWKRTKKICLSYVLLCLTYLVPRN